MKRSCPSLSALLERYFDHEVSVEERVSVENHLRECASCRESLHSFETVRTAIKAPVEEALRNENFAWVWQKIQAEIQHEEVSGWTSIWKWLDVSSLLRKRVWVPALAAAVVLLLITTPLLFKKSASHPTEIVVEYVDSQTNNVMVYEFETAKVTVIWLFEGTEEETSPS